MDRYRERWTKEWTDRRMDKGMNIPMQTFGYESPLQAHLTNNYRWNKSLYLLFTYKRRTIRPADMRRLLRATKLED